MSDYKTLIDEARQFTDGSTLGKVTARELDRAILIIRGLVNAYDHQARADQGKPQVTDDDEPSDYQHGYDAGYWDGLGADRDKPQVTDDYEAGYAEGFHHGRSTLRDAQVTAEITGRCDD